MTISEERIKEIIRQVLKDLELDSGHEEDAGKIWIICSQNWDERYQEFLTSLNGQIQRPVYAVVPDHWPEAGYAKRLCQVMNTIVVVTRSGLQRTISTNDITVFPVSDRDLVVKTALGISDTFETAWITSCIEKGTAVALWRCGLRKFSGNEPQAYVAQILSYYRKILTYGIKIGDVHQIMGRKTPDMAGLVTQEGHCQMPKAVKHRKKRVITLTNLEQHIHGSILFLEPGDIITDLAKERASVLNIQIKRQDREVTG